MSDATSPSDQPADAGVPPGTPPTAPPPPTGYAPVPTSGGPVGTIRPTGKSILLAVVTLGVYSLVWIYKTNQEMRDHRGGQGYSGLGALVFWYFLSPVYGFLMAGEVEKMYQARGIQSPVSTSTGAWNFPGAFILIGPIVWFVKMNGAINDYWASLGVTT